MQHAIMIMAHKNMEQLCHLVGVAAIILMASCQNGNRQDSVTEWQDALGFSAWGRHISVHNSTPQMNAHSIYTMYSNLK